MIDTWIKTQREGTVTHTHKTYFLAEVRRFQADSAQCWVPPDPRVNCIGGLVGLNLEYFRIFSLGFFGDLVVSSLNIGPSYSFFWTAQLLLSFFFITSLLSGSFRSSSQQHWDFHLTAKTHEHCWAIRSSNQTPSLLTNKQANNNHWDPVVQ